MPRAAAATARTAPARTAAGRGATARTASARGATARTASARGATARSATARGATARTAPTRTAPARTRPAPRRAPARPQPRRAPGKAVAVPRGARVLDALLTGRAWIALVGLLLAGIVFFNVDLLQMNRDITQMADKAAQVKRENDRLRHDYARLASSERIQEAAAEQGLVLPAPGEVRYLDSRPRQDARTASRRMTAPDPTYVAPEPITTVPEVPVTTTTPSTTIPPG